MISKSLTVSPISLLLLLAVSAPVMAQSPASQPLASSAAPAAAPASTVGEEGLSLSPEHGQTADQQGADRSACHNWSTGQSGYDPTLPNGGVPASEMVSRRDQYRRAMTVCLQARGYRVSYAPAASATPTLAKAGAAKRSKRPPLGCVSDTATRLPIPPGECAGVGNTYTKEDLDRTGQVYVQDALRMLDPALTGRP
jgi:hypothetical protein